MPTGSLTHRITTCVTSPAVLGITDTTTSERTVTSSAHVNMTVVEGSQLSLSTVDVKTYPGLCQIAWWTHRAPVVGAHDRPSSMNVRAATIVLSGSYAMASIVMTVACFQTTNVTSVSKQNV